MTDLSPEPRRLHPATLVVRWLKIVPQALAAVAAAVISMARNGLGSIVAIVAIVAVAALAGLVLAFLIWWRFRYTVGAGEIVIESGLINRQRRVIPYDRVQDIAIERRLLARLFGTAKVKIETGGSAADEGSLDMIALADAYALRDIIRRGHSESPPVAAVEEPRLFELGFGQLLYSGLFNFSLLFLAAIFAVLQYLEQFGLFDIEAWLTPENATAAAGYLGLRLTLVLIPLLLVLGLVSGVVRTVARDFGFRLTRTQAGLRRRRGLFTLSEVVIPVRRTQVAVIESGPIARQLGWYSLSFQTLGAEQKEGGVQVAAPFARMEQILPILAEAGYPPPPPRTEFVRVPRRALVRWAGPWLLLGAAVAVSALLAEPRAGVAAALLLAFGLFATLRWRKHAHALDDRALFVSSGLLKRRVWIVPFEKAQTISVGRGPLQRRLGLASLLVDTAGASAINSPEIVDLDAAEADPLADRLLGLFYEARSQRTRPKSRAVT